MSIQNSGASGTLGDSTSAAASTNPVSVHPMKKFVEDTVAEEVKRQGNGGGGDMSDLERRVGNLEGDVKAIKDGLHSIAVDVAIMKSNYATKSDMSDIKTEIAKETLTLTRWMVATFLAIMGVSIAIQRFIPPQSTSTPIAEHREVALSVK